jgi:integrase
VFRIGGRRYRESTHTDSKVIAREVEHKRRRELQHAINGLSTRNVKVAFAIAADDWLKRKEAGWAVKTYIAAKLDVKHLKDHFAGIPLAAISADDVSKYRQLRIDQGAARKTIANEFGTLRSILKSYRLWAALSEDLRITAEPEEVGRALSADEEQPLLRACAASRSRSLLPAVTLALNTGLRSSEIRLLTWQQIDFTHNSVTVGKSKTKYGTGRAVPLNSCALTTLREWAAQFPKRKPSHYVFPAERVGFSGNDEIPQVFDTEPTTPITSWKTAWNSARKAAKIECRLHDLRHTATTRLLERGVPFATVGTIMGWSPATTVRMARRYAHISDAAQREAMALLDTPQHKAEVPTLVSSSPTIQ